MIVIIIIHSTIRATSVNAQLPCLQRDQRTGSIWQDINNYNHIYIYIYIYVYSVLMFNIHVCALFGI